MVKCAQSQCCFFELHNADSHSEASKIWEQAPDYTAHEVLLQLHQFTYVRCELVVVLGTLDDGLAFQK